MTSRRADRARSVTTLPADWSPDVLDDIEREEYDHLIGYGITPADAVRRLGWSLDAVTRRGYARQT